MYTNHRHYILLILAFGTVLVSGIGYAVLYRAIESQSITAQETLKGIALENQKKQQDQDITSIYAKTADERARLNAAVLSQEKAVDFITAAEKIGTDTGVELVLSSISDEPIPGNATLGYFKGHIAAHGSWVNTMRALSLIENMPYGISFDNVSITESPTQDKKNPAKIWDLSLDIRVLTLQ